jgi:hypothetical protein
MKGAVVLKFVVTGAAVITEHPEPCPRIWGSEFQGGVPSLSWRRRSTLSMVSEGLALSEKHSFGKALDTNSHGST